MVMVKRLVLDVGNCGPDHAAIRRMLEQNFGVDVLQAHGSTDTLEMLRARRVDLVLINRKLDQDYSDGTEILKQIKADPGLATVPVMLVTNHEEYQRAAIDLGAERGFGKLSLNDRTTKELLSQFLGTAS
jgi:CheY-like chemotaxis protein